MQNHQRITELAEYHLGYLDALEESMARSHISPPMATELYTAFAQRHPLTPAEHRRLYQLMDETELSHGNSDVHRRISDSVDSAEEDLAS